MGPLDGLVVVDFSRVLAGPYATMLLGDMGAKVIKVESPRGDDTRGWLPPMREGVSTYYLGINRNKWSIVLDLTSPGDLETARELARHADIFVENFKVGGLEKFGLDYTSVSEANPEVIYASISGFGSGTLGREFMGYDLMVQAISGLMSLTGEADGEATKVGLPVVDIITGLHCAMGILAALNARTQTGKGQHVEVNLLSSILSGLVNHTSAFVSGGVVPSRMGNAHPSLYPYEPFPTKDGQIVLIVGNDLQFRRLAYVLGHPEWAESPLFGRNGDRTQNRASLGPLLVEALVKKTSDEWFHELNKAGVPCAPIANVAEGVAYAKEFGLEPVVEVGEGPTKLPMIAHPITFSESQISYRLAPPALGADRDAVLEWLRSQC